MKIINERKEEYLRMKTALKQYERSRVLFMVWLDDEDVYWNNCWADNKEDFINLFYNMIENSPELMDILKIATSMVEKRDIKNGNHFASNGTSYQGKDVTVSNQ